MASNTINADDVVNFDILEMPEEVLLAFLEPFEQENVDPTIEIQVKNENAPSISNENKFAPTKSGEIRAETPVNVESFIQGQKKVNTVKSTEKDIRNVQRWLWDNKKEPRLIEKNIVPEVLNDYLSELYITIRKADGTDYEPGSLETLKNSVERHLKDHGYAISLHDRTFHISNQALIAKKRQLKKAGLGRKSNASSALSVDDEKLLYEKGAMGIQTPESMQFTLFYMFGKIFSFRGRDEQRKLKFGDVTLKTDSTGTEYLEYAERDSKVFDGAKDNDCRTTTPRIYSCGDEALDPVQLYKKYITKRAAEMIDPESPFYLTPKKLKSGSTYESMATWYYPRPMGANTLGSLMKRAATNSGLTNKRLTNHSVRKTCVTTLSKAGVAPNKIIQVTGHKSLASIASYDSALTEDEQKSMSAVLLNKPAQANLPVTSSAIHKTPASATATFSMSQDINPQNIQNLAKTLFSGAYIHTLNFNLSTK